jgi:hypothetical protein
MQKPLVLGASVLCCLLAAVGQSSAQVATVPPQLQAAIKKVRSDAEIVRRDEISIVLDRHGNRTATGLANLIIALRHPGVIEEAGSSKQILLTLPGIERFWCESSATVFFWSKSAARFDSVWTGD